MPYLRFDDLPDVLTIKEVAAFMRVSVRAVYDMIRLYRATEGRDGLPVFMAGVRTMRVSKLELGIYIAGKNHGDAAASA